MGTAETSGGGVGHAKRKGHAPSIYRRGEGLEFDRVAFFTDAVFAIAMTLLIISVEAPHLNTHAPDFTSPETLWRKVNELLPQIFSFFLAFALIGRYWMAHHAFFSSLKSVDRGFITINLIYLSFVAFLPFPTSLVGHYEPNPTSVVLFAICLSIISGLEAVMFRQAAKGLHLHRDISVQQYRYGMTQSLVPVGLFMVSIPIAFWSPTVALTTWLLTLPIGLFIDRRAPEDARDVLPPTDP